MFTGIISHTGQFKSYGKSKREMSLIVPAPLARTLALGGSLSVDGVCLSLVRKDDEVLTFNLSAETLQKTTLGSLKRGQRLNLETPLVLSSPLGGHLVTGHIDAKGCVRKIAARAEGKRLTIAFPPDLRPYFVNKGSVAVSGVSLTVASLGASSFEVELIPITLKNSNLGALKPGDIVNIECDIIGKYVYNWMFKERV